MYFYFAFYMDFVSCQSGASRAQHLSLLRSRVGSTDKQQQKDKTLAHKIQLPYLT